MFVSIAAAQLSVDTLPNVASLHCVVQDGELGSGIPSFLIPFRILLSCHILDILNIIILQKKGCNCRLLQDNLSYHHPVSRYYEILSNGSASHIKFLK